MNDQVQRIWRDGLWDHNPALVQLLGLCPLLAVTTTAINGLGLGLATLAVLVVANVLVSSLRGLIAREVRIPVFVLIIATLVTVVDLLARAWLPELAQRLGIFLPLIVTNCILLGRAEAFASRHPVGNAALDGLAQGVGFMGVLLVLGAAREVLGFGSLLRDADLLLGDWAATLTLRFTDGAEGLLLAILPPGAFIGLALLIALKNRLAVPTPAPSPEAKPAPLGAGAS
ncbi:MAG: electron transport complex subunit E [Wenzhouxiangellaceae bacterium]